MIIGNRPECLFKPDVNPKLNKNLRIINLDVARSRLSRLYDKKELTVNEAEERNALLAYMQSDLDKEYEESESEIVTYTLTKEDFKEQQCH